MNTTLTHDPNLITQLLPVVIACLFFAAGWLGATVRAQAKAARGLWRNHESTTIGGRR